ncbi:hypothetical protein WH221_05910 [Chryseobacterium culicis]|uniref:Uncharacterized protein n=1 Tax=Chryseobacterium culicis TaxID=680127 RepID=A0A2S9CZ42_CHRCI|nr:hypothetical protein [Chryseobacterium culicis]PRB85783.1 hypothetical protein CQ022_05875 [Chryseobacterium culicis]PRB90493.1 hypothetical protein CQ033_07110 [Chryseobacterium culicis]
MKRKTNVFLDFGNTQFDGHLHNIVSKFRNGYKDNTIPGLAKDQLMRELTGKDPLTPESKWAVQQALMEAKQKSEKSDKTFDFFDAKGLNEFVKKSKAQEVDVIVLTASSFPNAIRAIYEIKGLTQLKDISMISVPIHSNRTVMAESKNTEIQRYEKEQKSRIKGLDTVHNIFVDDTKINIEVFQKSKNPATNIGILATRGIDLKQLNNEVDRTLTHLNTIGKPKPQSEIEPIYENVNPLKVEENQDIEEDLYGSYDVTGELKSSKHKYREEVVSTEKNNSKSASYANSEVKDMKLNLSRFTEPKNQRQREVKQGVRSPASNAQGIDRPQVAAKGPKLH